MNKKICVLLIASVSMSAFGGRECDKFNSKYSGEVSGKFKTGQELEYQIYNDDKASAEKKCNDEKNKEAANKKSLASQGDGVSTGTECNSIMEQADDPNSPVKNTEGYRQCQNLIGLSNSVSKSPKIVNYPEENVAKRSSDGRFKCDKPYSYTVDYKACESALAAYNVVINSEMAMNLTQTVRTDVKNSNIQKQANEQAASGDVQTAMFGAAEDTNKHMKQMETEKAMAYSAAVAALGRAYYAMPDQDDALKDCMRITPEFSGNCKNTVEAHKGTILANQSVKDALFEAIAQFTAKGIAAGIRMKQYDTKAKTIAKAKATVYDEGTDMMVEMCAANPNDPACITSGNRVSSSGTFGAGDFSLGGDGANNVFGVTPDSGTEFGDLGAETTLDDKNNVASINSPFKDQATEAKGILDPAAAAQNRPGSSSSGGGGGAGGMGGGSASLGSDLTGADTEGEKEAQIKAGKVSGTYNSAGGGGYRGIARGKDDANPFASLFDQKGGGVEEDRSIASGDIDGKASGLFEKISKRYGQIHADKRIEAKNFE